MRIFKERTLLSPSDLMRFQGCVHATRLDLQVLHGEIAAAPMEEDAGAALVQAMGDAHEQTYLQSLRAEGLKIIEIQKDKLRLTTAIEETRAALLTGPDIIYQAALFEAPWGGFADFLERIDQPSALGAFSYEVVDTKLKRSPDPKHVLQLTLYSDLVAHIQGRMPEYAHLVLGTGERVSLRLSDYAAYARRVRQRLEHFVASPWQTRPEPAAACNLCPWQEQCAAQWETEDNLCLVAGITKGQRSRLEAAGITTLSGLASARRAVPRLSPDIRSRLQVQAKLQAARRAGGPPQFQLRAIEPDRGLAKLPQPDTGDLYFDMEGDPYVVGGLEYLFGILWDDSNTECFKAIWAHDQEAERRATRQVLEFFAAHLTKHPGAHIYHYNHYEITALKRLASRYAIGEEILDNLLRQQRFIDLYRVVQQGIIASEPGYSLKNLEVFYLPPRSGEVTTAMDSIVNYEKWRETKDDSLLDDIETYNRIDCRSTKGLRDWLADSVRPAMPWHVAESVATSRQTAIEIEPAERAELRTRIDAQRDVLGDPLADLLFELAWFHQREDKPQWWAMFDRAERESAELLDDLDCLADLVAIGPARGVARSQVRRYQFPDQETKLRPDSQVKIHGSLATVTLTHIDPATREAEVKFGPSAGDPPDKLSLIPCGPLGNKVLRAGLRRFIDSVLAGKGHYRALEDLVRRRAPGIPGRRSGTPLIRPESDYVAETINVISKMKATCLPIQGPPGTGKTYVSARAIVTLLKAGKRVAVSSNSHKAIDNLLQAVVEQASADGHRFEIIKKVSSDEQDPGLSGIETTIQNEDARLFDYPLVGGTAWLFAREEHDQRFDYLFVDEAGQVSLANILAMGTVARNLVLVGDPMQLSQPIQGAHPGETGLSALEYTLHGSVTVPADRGIFLPVTRRLSSQICRYISDMAYEGRLTNDVDARKQRLVLPKHYADIPSEGLLFCGIDHSGNSQSSAEEAQAIADLFARLISCGFIDRAGNQRQLTVEDILVVSPYNAQVNLLKQHLPAGARVGTIDKFQGQEAPISLVSMATSSADELPRDIEFLFSRNRLNVAVSRAQALAIIFASPRLLDVTCRSLPEMRLVNGLCTIQECGKDAVSLISVGGLTS